MKVFLCIENGEEFLIEANSFTEAQRDVMVYGASVVREMSEKELKGEK